MYKADIGIGVTGTLGNVDPANQDSVPGHVYFAIARKEKDTGSAGWEKNSEYKASDLEPHEMVTVSVYERELQNWPTRYQYKLEIAQAVAEELKRWIESTD